nr:MAG TPA: hypothetical protein [Caudoviricetes sp.]
MIFFLIARETPLYRGVFTTTLIHYNNEHQRRNYGL